MEILFDERNQLLSNGVTVRSVVVGVHLVRVAIWLVAIELNINESWRRIGKPHSTKLRTDGHKASNRGVTRPVSADVNAQRPLTIRAIILRKNDARAKINRTTVKLAE